MTWCVFAAALFLCFHCQPTSSLTRGEIEKVVMAVKADVDSTYKYSRAESIRRVKRRQLSPSHLLRLLKQPSGLTRSAVRAADYMDNTIRMIQNSPSTRHKRALNTTNVLTQEDLELIAGLTGCSASHCFVPCNSVPNLNKFRTASSVCNNRENVRWGSSNIPFTRWLPAEYQDGVSTPKGWNMQRPLNGHLLPLVREVSNRILRIHQMEHIQSDPDYTHLVTIFGQWTDHDITFTPHSPAIRSFGDGVDCDQSCDNAEPCFPIKMPTQDPRFGSYSRECLPFFRSAPACGTGTPDFIRGRGNVRQQMNSLSSFIDVGQVYGSDHVKARSLRELHPDNGLLKINTQYNDNGRELLPFDTMGVNMCATRIPVTGDDTIEELPCFLAGDVRSNENIGLTSLHTLLMREHNRLARALKILNPHWSGERIYQEARKIMGGYFQVITYRDYLPHIVGPAFTSSHLSTYPGYNYSVDPSISNVFATAAYRFAHLAVQPFMFRLDERYQEHPTFRSPLLHKAFFTPWRILFEGGLDPILRGLVGRKAKLNIPDGMMPDALRERLFEFTSDLALDLAALNLQRGRDHGLPGYNKWREHCGLSQPQTLSELKTVMENDNLAEHLWELYGTADNIDVWLGGIAEPFVPGGRVGPLFACLIATQFKNIREGDRLWWEKDGVFTVAQRNSLSGTSLSRIICDNTGITEVPRTPFHYRERGSGYTNCEDIPAFDLSPWHEDDGNTNGYEQGPGHLRPPSAGNFTFHVRHRNYTPLLHGTIAFQEVVFDRQNIYNRLTGEFTCKRSGIYEFQYAVIVEGSVGLKLMHNGNVVQSLTSSQRGVVTSGCFNKRLSVYDRVWVETRSRRNMQIKDGYFSASLLETDD